MCAIIIKSTFETAEDALANYDIAEDWEKLSPGQRARVINLASDEQLKKWASDESCNQKLICDVALAQQNTPKRGEVPFYPRTEVSADARYIAGRIIKHLWIIFVALPFVLAILFVILK